MSEVAKRIFIARQQKGFNKAQLARTARVQKQTLQKIEEGSSANPTGYVLKKLAKALDVSVDWLLGDGSADLALAKPSLIWQHTIPIVGTAPADQEGCWSSLECQESNEGHVNTPSIAENSYSLRVRGDGLFPAIRSGWFVIVEPEANLQVGEYVIARTLAGQSMIKELLYNRDDEIGLLSINRETRRSLSKSEIDFVHPIGCILPPSKFKGL